MKILHDLGCVMKKYINKNEAVTQFALSKRLEKLYLAELETMEDKVNYVFTNGFVDVGDLPCRKKFWREQMGRDISFHKDITWHYLYYRPSETKVDSSSFWHRPHHVQQWAKTILTVNNKGSYCFELTTCGGVYIWVNGIFAQCFTHYQRNNPKATRISLDLTQGDNEITIFFDDIAERDTYFYFQLEYLDGAPLYAQFPANAGHVSVVQYGDFIQNLSFIIKDNRITLQSIIPAFDEIKIQCKFAKHPHESKQVQDYNVTFSSSSTYVDVTDITALGSGFWFCTASCEIEGQKISKLLNMTIAPQKDKVIYKNREARFKAILNILAHEGDPRIGRVIAAFKQGHCDQKIESIIEHTLQQISQREDCSDFLIIPLLHLWKKYAGQYLNAKTWQRIRSTILGWRYWIDEPGNDAMWFWSENHCLCFHVAQYLAGSIFFDSIFINSNRYGFEQKQIAYARLIQWFDHLEESGFVEWNSIAYYPIDLIGLLALCEFAEDPHLKKRAIKATDWLFCMTAIHSINGRAAGAMGRAYEKELLSGNVNELSTYVHALWGGGVINKSLASLPQLLDGHYRPESHMDEIANWQDDDAFEARYFQGVNKNAKLVSWKNQSSLLSTVVDHNTGAKGHQQHLLDLSFAGHDDAKIWINHPGELEPNGQARPSFWAGNGILPRINQYRNRAFVLMNHKQHPIDFSHIYLPQKAFDEVIFQDRSIFCRCATAYAAIFASDILSFEPTADPNEIRLNQARSAWFICVGHPNQDGGFDSFVSALKDKKLDFTNLTARFDDPFLGSMSLSWQGEFSHPYTHMVPKSWSSKPLISLETKPDYYFPVHKLSEVTA